MQYPLRIVEPLKNLLYSTEDIIFVENRKNFEDVLKNGKYEDYFVDNFGSEFGHGSPRGNRLIAENVANVIIKEVFKK